MSLGGRALGLRTIQPTHLATGGHLLTGERGLLSQPKPPPPRKKSSYVQGHLIERRARSCGFRARGLHMSRNVIRLLVMTAAAVAFLAPARSQSANAGNQIKPRKSVPRMADGKPDFTGVWAGPGFSHKVGPEDTEPNIIQTYPREMMAPFQPGGEALLSPKPTGDLAKDDALSLCMPVGVPRSITGPFAQEWIQTPRKIAILYEWFRTWRVIPLDGRPHPKDLNPTWFGDSVGKWEGDTLVIDTVGLKAWTIDETVNEFPSKDPKSKQ